MLEMGLLSLQAFLVVFIGQIAGVPADNHMEYMHINKSHSLDAMGNFTRELSNIRVCECVCENMCACLCPCVRACASVCVCACMCVPVHVCVVQTGEVGEFSKGLVVIGVVGCFPPPG